MRIYVDADACPVVKIVEKTAQEEDIVVTQGIIKNAYERSEKKDKRR